MRQKQTISVHRYYRPLFTMAVLVMFFVEAAFGQEADSLPTINLRSVKSNTVHRSIPYQYLTKETISKLNSISVADAVKFLPGVIVKDYGGIGGLKTISVRSLGANSTAVMYDGIVMSDAQNGQIDLGKISVDNIDNIAVYNAQPVNIFLPARSFTAASIVVLESTPPDYNTVQRLTGRATVKAGSFGFISPALYLQFPVNKNFYQRLSTEYQYANGKYKFKGYEQGSGKLTRKNGDVNAVRLEYDAGYTSKDSGLIKLKSYYYHSARGLPGAVVLYNSQTREKLADENFFIQGSFLKNLSVKNRVLFNLKYSLNNNNYTDPDYPNSQGGLTNKFRQDEYYMSGVYGGTNAKFSWSYATDFFIARLRRNDNFSQGFPNPVRVSWLNNLSAKLNLGRAEFSGNVLYSRISDKTQLGENAKDIDNLSPTLAIMYFPIKAAPLSVRAFYKRVFRIPTFNDLYYTFIGNTSLRPEFSNQYDLGFAYAATGKNLVQAMSFTSDFYVNDVTDKILAVPRQNLFQWSMLNVGKVIIKGVDVAVQLYSKNFNSSSFSTRVSYSFQQARDKSKGTSSYNNQLPYTPKHSGSVTGQYSVKQFAVAYNVLLSGPRYRVGDQTAENIVKAWATQDVSVTYKFHTQQKLKYKLILEANNIFNQQYEVIRYYPMPGVNFRAGLTVQF